MPEVLQDYEQRPVGRPTFLTVLCILTFIGSSLGIISAGFQYATADKRAREMSVEKDRANAELKESDKDDAGTRFAGKVVNAVGGITADDLRNGALLEIFGAIICLSGAFMMWKLKKTGYYIYIVGILIGIVSPFIIFGSSNIVAIMTSAFVGFIGIVFIILYGVNVKHMR